MALIPTVPIEQQRVAGRGNVGRSRNDQSWLAGLPLRASALLLAHGLATLTLLLSLTTWSDWRSADQSVNPWLLLALVLLLCLNPFAALAISAVLESPAEALSIARSLAGRPLATGNRNAIILFALGFSSAVLLASVGLMLLLRLT